MRQNDPMPIKRHSMPFPGTEIDPRDVHAEAFILMTLGAFTPEEDRHLRQVDAETLELGEAYLDDFYDNFARDYSIPQRWIDAIPEMWKAAKSKIPDLTPRQFAEDTARPLFQDLVFFD